MPLFEFVCMSGHVSERLVRTRDLPDYTRCDECNGPSFRKDFGMVAMSHSAEGLHSERLATYYDTAREMEYQVNRSDDPQVQEMGTRIAHAAKVRAEGQMLAGAQHWSPDKRWNHKEVD